MRYSVARGTNHLLRRSSAYLETLPAERLDQFIDSRRAMLEQVERECVPQLYARKRIQIIHRRTMACRGDKS